jgi:hypothetical protein
VRTATAERGMVNVLDVNTIVRLFYGAVDNPTLELAGLPIIDVLGPWSRRQSSRARSCASHL